VCSNVKFVRREIVRYLPGKKRNSGCLSNCRPLSLLHGSRPKPARTSPNNVLTVLQISSKWIYFQRSYSRTREHRFLPRNSSLRANEKTNLQLSLSVCGVWTKARLRARIVSGQPGPDGTGRRPRHGRRHVTPLLKNCDAAGTTFFSPRGMHALRAIMFCL